MPNKEIDLKTIYILKIHTIKHLIANTNNGPLELNIRKDENEYFFTLDSVPVSKEVDKELRKIYNV